MWLITTTGFYGIVEKPWARSTEPSRPGPGRAFLDASLREPLGQLEAILRDRR